MAGENGGDDVASAADAGSGADAETTACPECGATLPAGARFCPECATAIDEEGDAVDLSELDGDVLPDEPAELLTEDETGARRASGRVRALAGLAVSIPLAPLALFLVGSVAPLSLPSAALVFLGGWLGSAAVLSRARVPAEAFGHSLYLIALGTLLVPVALAVGGVDTWEASLSLSFEVLAVVSLAIAGALVALGTFVTNQARKGVAGQHREFEQGREE